MISNGVKNKRKLFAERATIKPNSNMNKVSQIENKNNNLEPQAYANKKRHYKPHLLRASAWESSEAIYNYFIRCNFLLRLHGLRGADGRRFRGLEKAPG